MSRSITSPVKEYPGTVTLPDYLNPAQDLAFSDGNDEAMQYDPKKKYARFVNALLPGILACVEKWELQNFPADPSMQNFPMTPRGPSSELLAWVMREITVIYEGADNLPNG